ncbi:MAG TPA: polyprenyl synthetase family protein [Thermomicrobiales bacterium]
MTLQRTDVFGTMRADLDRVNARVAQAAEVSYPVVADLLSDIVQAGGKRLRPLLLLLAGRAYDYEANFDRLVTAAAGVELLHTASLIHDDTVDRSALRRGKPTLNSMLSSGAVILIGDYLFAQSAMLAAATDSTRVVSVFASTLGDICDGQLMEIFDAQRLDQTREEYERRIYGKTASLFAGSAEMGAILGHAPESHIAALRRYGADLGTAFQIVDDILDVTGATGELGKPAGNDLRQGTVTLPTIFYLAGHSNTSAQWQEIEAIVGGHAADNGAVDDAIRSIRSSGAIDKAVAVAEEYVDRAKETAALVPDDETRDLLAELADLAVHRVS